MAVFYLLVFAFVIVLTYGDETRIVSCDINQSDREHKEKTDGLSFDLLFEGYTMPKSTLSSFEPVLGAVLELEQKTSPIINGKEQYCEVIKSTPGG